MGYQLNAGAFDRILDALAKDYEIYAPVRVPNKGAYSDTDLVTYGRISKLGQMELNEKTRFSAKEVIYPITQTLFYFTEENYSRPAEDQKGIIVFCRPCDVNAFNRLDEIFLNNGPHKDSYYEVLRKKVKFFVIECLTGFDSCFCVSMGTNKAEHYDVFLRIAGNSVVCDVKGDLLPLFAENGNPVEMIPSFIEENKTAVNVPEQIDQSIFEQEPWKEYSSRCIACGRCTVACPTCSCFTMQDIFYDDNPNCGERRRVWASCMVDGFTGMAGGHEFRKENGDRMRFKVLHKIYDFRKRFGYNMCVGCGRCEDVCPEYISFVQAIDKINYLGGGEKNE